MDDPAARGHAGYAVVDLETTGINPEWNERIVEVGVVHVAPDGQVEGQWETLVNPNRDLGPQRIHGITGREVREAPTFEHVAGPLSELLAGRVLVAHNLRFDAGFLATEYRRLGVEVPVGVDYGLCTMRLARSYLPGAGRSLADCCAVFDIDNPHEHRALTDATATARLLSCYLDLDPAARHWYDSLDRAAGLSWPPLPRSSAEWLPREAARGRQRHFLGRLVEHMPGDEEPEDQAEYLAMLDRVLLDREISAHEADELVALAEGLGIGRQLAHRLHARYVDQLARAAWSDGVITENERHDLRTVGSLLGMSIDEVDGIIAEQPPADPAEHARAVPMFSLAEGDKVVFTGATERPREQWERAARDAGLVPHPAMTKKVKLLVAADPDSLSGKARKARQYGIPIVGEETFERLLGSVQ
ncbi:DNA polymerase III subunit epsilon [Haloechinothrix sp. YIM 98757]|uniref:DNA polymerase III subunit epsilon n=1 Tax=Haloechinothrix aidingensis TaxID=2752311 RepID=A0A838A9C9_9PSEU|nr:exonuclease domain-containing protein [Haloechinothrix aidingensis]MBA0126128.1 DNA polymerase III subunit epsilon [Haloechinothrix aidingensis]